MKSVNDAQLRGACRAQIKRADEESRASFAGALRRFGLERSARQSSHERNLHDSAGIRQMTDRIAPFRGLGSPKMRMVNPLDLESAELDALRALQAGLDDQPDSIDPVCDELVAFGLVDVTSAKPQLTLLGQRYPTD